MVARTITGAACAALVSCASLLGQGIQGPLTADTTWSGEVTISGDVTVKKGATLTVLPGTRITLAAQDARSGGWNTATVEVHVEGRLLVRGTADEPVHWLPQGFAVEDAAVPSEAPDDWHGIVLHNDDPNERSEILHARIGGAVAGVQAPHCDPLIADCVFHTCGVGVEAGAAYKNTHNHGIAPKRAQPEIVRCRFAGCHAGVFVEGQGSPDIRRSVFYRCRVGVGNDRPGVSRPLSEPGPVLQRCALIECRQGAQAPSIVRDGMFVGCTVALAMSSFHAPFTTTIDHMAVRHNLIHDCDEVARGELGLDVGGVRAEPGFAGSLATLGGMGVPIPASMELAEGSAARGRASDGGDLGPTGELGRVLNGVVWSPATAPIERGLVVGAEVKGRQVARGTPEPGGALGKAWWVAGTFDRGALDLRRTFGEPRAGWLALPVERTSGPVAIEVNGDTDSFEVLENAKSLWLHEGRRRYGMRGVRQEIEVKDSIDTLLVRIQGWGAEPRVGIALEGLRLRDVTGEAPGALTVRKARMTKHKRKPVLEITTEQPLHWGDPFRDGWCEVRDGRSQPLPGGATLSVSMVDVDTIRIEIPESWDKPLTVVLTGLRSPSGVPYGDPDPVRIE